MSQSEILEHSTRYANAFDIEYGEKAISYKAKRIVEQNKKLVNSNMEYKMLTTQELKSISDFLKKQLVDKFIWNFEGANIWYYITYIYSAIYAPLFFLLIQANYNGKLKNVSNWYIE